MKLECELAIRNGKGADRYRNAFACVQVCVEGA